MKPSKPQLVAKRIFDLVVSAIALLLLWPLMLIIALLVRIFMGSPVLFRQKRPGYKEKLITIYKFRTMTEERDERGELLPDEKRLTRLGKFLRSFSLDELPQFWSVLKGDLSIVGPRPLLVEYLELYTPEQRRRHEVMPGLFSWATVKGRNANTWEKKFELDLWYVDHWSFWLDLKICFMVLPWVLTSQGISEEGQATMSKFTGTKERKSEG